MNKQYKVGDKVFVRGIVNSEVRNGGIHVLHDGIDAFYMLDQIHEPQKVVVPKFVAEWIEYCKLTNVSLYDALDFDEVSTLNYANAHRDENEILKWLASANNQETFARAWLFGFEIEQERLYTVEIPNPNAKHDDVYILGRALSGEIVIWRIQRENDNGNYGSNCQLTEAEIKQDFEWAWQFAKEAE